MKQLFFAVLLLISGYGLCASVSAEAEQLDAEDLLKADEAAEDETEEDTEEEEDAEDSQPVGDLPEPLLSDINGNGQVEVVAFGDSITRGVGDFTDPRDEVERATSPSGEAGYPLRVELQVGVPVTNLGDPGERLATQGLYRFADIIPRLTTDFVIISGGTNDALSRIASSEFFRSVQTMINISKALNIVPVLATAPPVCCDHRGLTNGLKEYNKAFRDLAVINDIELADIHKAYTNTCRVGDCYLLNRPEGAHPNIVGYDVSGEVVIATLLNIDIFAPDGPALLEQALDLPADSVTTVPDVAPTSRLSTGTN